MFSKIGIHVIGNLPLGNVVATAGHQRPPVVTLTNCSTAYIVKILQAWPGMTVVVRYTDWPNDLGRFWRLPTQNVLLQSRNEPAINSLGDAARLCEAEQEWLANCHSHGYNAALLTPSVGNFREDYWSTFAPLFSQMRGADRVALHEYWAGKEDIANPWHCGRWRLIPELANVLLVVTECGRDVVEGHGTQGWLKGGISAEQYLSEIAQYSELLAQQDNVLGATLFTVGNDSRWRDYDVSRVWSRICQQADWPEAGPTPDPRPMVPEGVEETLRRMRREMQSIQGGVAVLETELREWIGYIDDVLRHI